MTNYETFRQLHYQPQPLLIGNAWDVVSAKVFEQKGFKAVATSSAALARTMGYEDGERIPFQLVLNIVERISKSINVPLSVDMEGGYSRSIPGIIENIERLHGLGVVGINIEDSSKDAKGELMAIDRFCEIITAIANHLAAKNMGVFINVRTDAFVHRLPLSVQETLKRARAYEQSGASGIFVPFLCTDEDIKAIVLATSLPVSVFSTPQLPPFGRLASLGIKRISMGTVMHRAVTAWLEKSVNLVLGQQSFDCLY